MTADADLASTDQVTAITDELRTLVADHADRIAAEYSQISGTDTGTLTLTTDTGEWTLKYTEGQTEWLRYDPTDTYVISTKQPPGARALVDALEDYPAMVDAFNDYIHHLTTQADALRTDLTDERGPPDIASTDAIQETREAIIASVRADANVIASEHQQVVGDDSGTFTASIDNATWELKWSAETVDWLRVGGRRGTYLISQYEPPTIDELDRLMQDYPAFIDAWNQYVDSAAATLQQLTPLEGTQ